MSPRVSFFVTTGLGIVLPIIAQSAELVILTTTAVDYKVGHIVFSDTGINLDENESLVLLSENGAIIEMNGPFIGLPSGNQPKDFDIRQAVEKLVGVSNTSRTTMGGVRGDDDKTDRDVAGESDITDSRPSPWLLHIRVPGDQCVLRNRSAKFWRESASDSTTLEIERLYTGQVARVAWPNEEQQLDWPGRLPLVSGETYLVRPDNELRSTAIQIHELSETVVATDAAAAAWLAANGCGRQASMLLEPR